MLWLGNFPLKLEVQFLPHYVWNRAVEALFYSWELTESSKSL